MRVFRQEVDRLPHTQEGEDLQGLAVREALEETGLTVSELRPYGLANNPVYETIAFPNGDISQYFAMLFYTRSYSGTPHPADDESHEIKWFSHFYCIS